MSLTQGYQKAGAIAEGLKGQLEGMQDKPAGVVSTSHLPNGTSAPASSVAGIPGYYHTQNQAEDVRMGYRLGAAQGDANNVYGPSGYPNYTRDFPELRNFKVNLTPEDIKFFEERRAEQQQIEFDEFFMSKINLADPGESRWAQQVYPQLWERRERFIDDQINVEARAAKIRSRGFANMEDLKFAFAVHKGLINLPTEPAFSATPGGQTYKRGWFAARPPIGGNEVRGSNPAPAAFSMQNSLAGGRTAANILAGFGSR